MVLFLLSEMALVNTLGFVMLACVESFKPRVLQLACVSLWFIVLCM